MVYESVVHQNHLMMACLFFFFLLFSLILFSKRLHRKLSLKSVNVIVKMEMDHNFPWSCTLTGHQNDIKM